MSEIESLSEREFAAEIEDDMTRILGLDQPHSVGEAVEEEEEPEVVHDEPPRAPEPGDLPPVPDAEPEGEPGTEEEEEPEAPEDEDEPLSWVRRKYGEDVSLAKLAKVTYDQEQTISRLGSKARENENLAAEWYQYAQNLERQIQSAPTGMPMSSAEENWVEQAMANPLQAALGAKMNGNEQLYRAVVNRVSQEDPVLAGQVASYVEMAYAEQARVQAANDAGAGQPSDEQKINASLQRVGVDLQKYGPQMQAVIGELGEYHPYTQAILHGSDSERDLAFQAVYDVVRERRVVTRQVRDSEREEQIKREGELRRKAAGVMTGAPHRPDAVKQSPFMEAMEAEWKRSGQWKE